MTMKRRNQASLSHLATLLHEKLPDLAAKLTNPNSYSFKSWPMPHERTRRSLLELGRYEQHQSTSEPKTLWASIKSGKIKLYWENGSGLRSLADGVHDLFPDAGLMCFQNGKFPFEAITQLDWSSDLHKTIGAREEVRSVFQSLLTIVFMLNNRHDKSDSIDYINIVEGLERLRFLLGDGVDQSVESATEFGDEPVRPDQLEASTPRPQRNGASTVDRRRKRTALEANEVDEENGAKAVGKRPRNKSLTPADQDQPEASGSNEDAILHQHLAMIKQRCQANADVKWSDARMTLETRISERGTEIERLKEQNDKKDADIKALRKQMAEMDAEMEALKKGCVDLEERIERQRKFIENVQQNAKSILELPNSSQD